MVAMTGLTRKSVALQRTITAIAICGALVPIVMSVGILVWGGLDKIILVFLIVSATATCALIVNFLVVKSTKVVFQQVGLVSTCAVAVVTIVYSLEFIIFRDPSNRLLAPVPVFGLSIPLIAMYGFSLISLCLESLFTFHRIQRLKHEVTPCPR